MLPVTRALYRIRLFSGSNARVFRIGLGDNAPFKGSQSTAIKTAGEKPNESWQAVSAELYKAASEKTPASQGPAGSSSETQSEAGGAPDGGKKGEGPIIDAEVVEDRKAA